MLEAWSSARSRTWRRGGIVGKKEYREVLAHVPAGVFDARSWAYWNLICGRRPAPPLPVRGGATDPVGVLTTDQHLVSVCTN
jgi:hypothetical protein